MSGQRALVSVTAGVRETRGLLGHAVTAASIEDRDSLPASAFPTPGPGWPLESWFECGWRIAQGFPVATAETATTVLVLEWRPARTTFDIGANP